MNAIKKLKINGSAFLAPMADYTNVAFRTLCKEYGAGLAYTELVSVKGLLYKNKKTPKLLAVSEKEKPVFLQLFGNNPKDFSSSISIVEKEYPNNFAGYDINCGCSVPKAVRGNYGSSLMDYPDLIGNIVKEMVSVTDKPITLKMRLGTNTEKFLDVAKAAQNSGVSALTLHARLGSAGYSGNANWSKIKELKENVDVPVIGNGDISNYLLALKMKEETSCDYLMVGRATIGNAFIFKQINQILLNEKVEERTISDQFVEAEKFLELAKEFELGVNDVRGYFIGWSKGIAGAASLRNSLAISKEIKEIEDILFKEKEKSIW